MEDIKYAVTTPDRLRQLCVEQAWFKGGSNEQYEKMVNLNEEGKPLSVIAGVIWLCSDNDLPTIRDILEKERDAYLAQINQPADSLYALKLKVVEENTFAVRAENLVKAKEILEEAYNAGWVNMSAETTDRSVEITSDLNDQEYIDIHGADEFVIIE